MDTCVLRYIFGVAATCLITACSGGGSDGDDGNGRPRNKQSFTISTSVDGNGQVDPSTATIQEGASADFHITAAPGHTVEGITGCDGTLNGTTITVENPSSDCTIHVTIVDTGDHEAPTAKILFPWEISKTSNDSITVSGTASDRHEISSILVNDIYAKISRTPSKSNESGTRYNYRWHATIPVNVKDETKISVSTQDSLQNTNSEADSVTLLFDGSKIPHQLAINPSDNEIFYITNSGQYSKPELIKFKLGTREKTVLPTNIPINPGNLNHSASSELLISVGIDLNPETQEYIATIYSIDIETGNSEIAKIHPLGINDENWVHFEEETTTFSERENAVYIAQQITPYDTEDPSISRILKLPLGDSELEIILETHSDSNNHIWPTAIEYTSHGLLLLNERDLGSSLGLLALDGSSYTQITEDQLPWATSLSVNTDENIAYLLNSGSITQVAIPEGTTISTVNANSTDGTFDLGNITSTVLDNINDHLIVSSHTYDAVKKINNKDGQISTLISNGLGSGPELGYLYNIALDIDKNIVFASQPGAPAKIFEVDLNTGARSLFEEIPDSGGVNNYIHLGDLVLDNESQILYILMEDRVLQRNIATGHISTLTSNSTATGQSITLLTSAALDKDNNRLLVIDAHNSIVAVNLSTGTRTLVSKNGVKGAGTDIDSIGGIDVDPENQTAFVFSSEIGALYEVDLISGNRKLLTDTCLSTYGQDYLGEGSWIYNIRFNEFDGHIYALSDYLLRVDPDTTACEASFISMLSDFDFTSEGQTIAASKSEIKQFRFESSEQVVISK